MNNTDSGPTKQDPSKDLAYDVESVRSLKPEVNPTSSCGMAAAAGQVA